MSDSAALTALRKARSEVLALCQRFDPEPAHALHVTKLALKLFDLLKAEHLHALGVHYRLLLEYGCMLHDIGWVDGQPKHHKRALQMIQKSKLPLGTKDKLMVGLIARFHRKAAPADQEELQPLNAADRQALQKLAAIIRLADVLDRFHDQRVRLEGIALTPAGLEIGVSSGFLRLITAEVLSKKTAYFREAFGCPALLVEAGAPQNDGLS